MPLRDITDRIDKECVTQGGQTAIEPVEGIVVRVRPKAATFRGARYGPIPQKVLPRAGGA